MKVRPITVLLFTITFLLSTIGTTGITPLHAQIPTPSAVTQTSADSPSLMQQGKAFYEAGQFSEAVTVLQQAVDTFQSQGDTRRQAIAFSNLALAYQQLGQWSEAQQAITSSLQLLQNLTTKDQLKLQGAALDIQGQLYLAQGQLKSALESFSSAVEAYTQAGDQRGVTQSQINQSQALQASGLYRRALDILQEVNKTLQQQPDSQLKAVGLRSLGMNLRLVGNLEESQKVLEQSLVVAKALQSNQEISATLLSLGNTVKAQGDIPAALNYYQQAAETATLPTTKIQAQLNQLSLLVAIEQQVSAERLQQQIQSQLNQLPPSRTAVDARINLASSLIKLRHIGYEPDASPTTYYPEIASQLSTAVNQARKIQDPKAESYALGELGALYERNQQLSEAREMTKKALVLAQSNNAPEIAYRWQWQLGRLLKAQGNIQDAIAAYQAAVSTLESIRSDLVSINADVQFSFRESVEPIYRELVALLLDSEESEPNQNNLAQARNVIESLQLAELVNFFREDCLNGIPIQIDQVDPQAAVIYPIVLKDRLEVVVSLPKAPLRHYATRLPQAQVEEIFTQLRDVLSPSNVDPTRGQTVVVPQFLRGVFAPILTNRSQGIVSVRPRTGSRVSQPAYLLLAQKVYDWLIRPAEQDLAASGVKTLVFVLDGPLLNLPMAVLHDGQQFLVEKYALALTPGLQLLDPKPLARGKLFALKAGLSEARQGFSSLPFVENELEQIRSQISGELLLNQQFTSAAIQKEIDAVPFPVIHLATHGQFSSNADETFILTWDGRLNINQLNNILRTREERGQQALELLVLSACQTAAGDQRAALGLAGVAVRAGARSTLATLWFVSDQATAELMIRFYKELADPSITKAEALRRAQVSLLKEPGYQDPILWAAYVLVGNWL